MSFAKFPHIMVSISLHGWSRGTWEKTRSALTPEQWQELPAFLQVWLYFGLLKCLVPPTEVRSCLLSRHISRYGGIISSCLSKQKTATGSFGAASGSLRSVSARPIFSRALIVAYRHAEGEKKAPREGG